MWCVHTVWIWCVFVGIGAISDSASPVPFSVLCFVFCFFVKHIATCVMTCDYKYKKENQAHWSTDWLTKHKTLNSVFGCRCEWVRSDRKGVLMRGRGRGRAAGKPRDDPGGPDGGATYWWNRLQTTSTITLWIAAAKERTQRSGWVGADAEQGRRRGQRLKGGENVLQLNRMARAEPERPDALHVQSQPL